VKRPATTICLVVVLVAATAVPAFARADWVAQTASGTVDYAVVSLESAPAASYEGGNAGLARTKPQRGRLDTSSPAYKAYHKHLQNEHASYRSYLKKNAPAASIVREYYVTLNAVAVKLNGTKLSTLAAGPKAINAAESWAYRPTMNVSTGLIRATEVWGDLGGASDAGSGVKVAIIDTGIDTTSPFFDDAGLPAQTQTDACPDQDLDPATSNTNDKVVVCRVYASGVSGTKDGQALFFDHGTHVAGTVAGRNGTSGTVAGTDVVVDGLSGVAPGALLGNYNVFPGFGSGFIAKDGEAWSHDIAAAVEDAVQDGMDVANLSLGGRVQGPQDILVTALNAAVDAGMVVVVAAGNEGPGDSTASSPGTAEKVITAGATTNPHFVGIPVTTGSGTFGAALGDFATFDPAITADYTVTEPADGCSAITTALTGKIALIDRGVCTFTTKVRNAETAGAVGALIVNNVAGDPVGMATDGTLPEPTISAAMLGKAEGNAVKPSGTATVDGTAPQEILSDNADIIAGFSSRGPTPFEAQIKPDLTAPGVNVLSSVFDGEFAFFQGTSMATPHTAGAAALILAGFPDATPAEVKSRLVNSAARVVTDHINGTTDPGVLARGGGRIDLVEAFDAATWFAPVSVSFGEIKGNPKINETQSVSFSGTDAVGVTVAFVDPDPGVDVDASISGSEIVVTLTAARKQAAADYSGDLVVTASDGQTYLIPWFVRIS